MNSLDRMETGSWAYQWYEGDLLCFVELVAILWTLSCLDPGWFRCRWLCVPWTSLLSSWIRTLLGLAWCSSFYIFRIRIWGVYRDTCLLLLLMTLHHRWGYCQWYIWFHPVLPGQIGCAAGTPLELRKCQKGIGAICTCQMMCASLSWTSFPHPRDTAKILLGIDNTKAFGIGQFMEILIESLKLMYWS